MIKEIAPPGDFITQANALVATSSSSQPAAESTSPFVHWAHLQQPVLREAVQSVCNHHHRNVSILKTPLMKILKQTKKV